MSIVHRLLFKYNVRAPCDGEVEAWVLADYGRNVWRIKVVAWNDLARKFQKTLPKGTNVRITNFILKHSSWEADQLYGGQHTCEIHLMNLSKLTVLENLDMNL